MIDTDKRKQRQEEINRVRTRMRTRVDTDNYEYIPAKKPVDYYNDDVHQRVAIYVRVSTDDIRQTTSYELQKKYYEDFVTHHPNWTLVGIYADEGISGTSLKHREEFKRMISDCKAGKIDLVVTKSVSRFARNVVNCIGIVRDLSEMRPPVGVFFESECIFSLNDDSQMALSFQATMAEEESHTRSRSMESSLRMRLDNGIPLTPKLLGHTHDADKNLIINPEEAPTVKLAFFMYLYGYSTKQIAKVFNALGKKSYLGNINWTANGIVQILRNERHCGEVLTRKTYTENYRTHRTLKNRGEKPQSRYLNHHEAIVSRDDYIAVQRMLDSAKYRNKSILPELRVMDSGILKGFVVINPRWAGFKEAEYYQASKSVYDKTSDADNSDADSLQVPPTIEVEVEAGDFDLRGFEVTRASFLDSSRRPTVTFENKRIKFSAECAKRFGSNQMVELLINPVMQRFAVRIAPSDSRNAVAISSYSTYTPRAIPATAFYTTLCSLFDWKEGYKYRIIGDKYEQDGAIVYVFDVDNAEAYLKSQIVIPDAELDSQTSLQPLTRSRNHVRAVPEEWVNSFGKQFYVHELPFTELESLSEDDWKLRLNGQIFETGKKLKVTEFSILQQYIKEELSSISIKEVLEDES